ncbi:aldolase [Paenibacillus sp. GCM10027628]|uniref:aldolase n=1 Tax=Paenibacillus sp. GCM10027628 TaxID=3273413 RepID=UPI0036386D05
MIAINSRNTYKAFGMHVSSEIPLPELMQSEGLEHSEDLVITMDNLTQRWDEMVDDGNNFIAQNDVFLFKIPDTAIYCMEKGSKITVSPLPGADIDKVRLFLLGTCMGATLLQRRVLPLHGSAVVIDGKAYAFVGESGAGKSTLAAAFGQKGYQLLTDDVIAVTLNPELGMAIVHPAYPQQKLWQQSMDHFGLQSNQFSPIFQEENKFAVPVFSNFHQTEIPLAGVFELTKSENDTISMTPMNSLEKIYALMRHTYRGSLITKMGLQQWHFTMTAAIAGQIQMYNVLRSTTRFTAFDLVSQITHQIDEGEFITQ